METSETVQQEIAQLEKQLAEKRASFEKQTAETSQEAPHDKEVLKQMVGERIQQQAPTYQIASPKPQANSSRTDENQSYNDPQLVEKVQQFVNQAFNTGIDDAVKSAVSSNNPALIDAFHDVLVDKLYETLLERKKLEKVK